MASKQEFNTSLREIGGLVDTIGDEIVQDISGQTEQGASLDGYECRHRDSVYQVIGTQIWDYFVVRYPYNAAQDLAVMQARAEAMSSQSRQQNKDINLDQQAVESAAADIRDRLDSDGIEEIRSGLMDRIAEAEFIPELLTHEGVIIGFNIDKRVYPYTEDFTVRRFDRAVQGVVTLGRKGQSFLHYRYGLGEFAEELGLDPQSRGSRTERGDQHPDRGFE